MICFSVSHFKEPGTGRAPELNLLMFLLVLLLLRTFDRGLKSLSIHPDIFVCLSPTSTSIVHLTVHLSVSLSIYSSIYPSFSIYPSISSSFCPSLSIYRSVYLSFNVYFSVFLHSSISHLSIYLSTSVHLSIFLFSCLVSTSQQQLHSHANPFQPLLPPASEPLTSSCL